MYIIDDDVPSKERGVIKNAI